LSTALLIWPEDLTRAAELIVIEALDITVNVGDRQWLAEEIGIGLGRGIVQAFVKK